MRTNRDKKAASCSSDRHREEELTEYQAKFKVLFENVCSGVAVYEARNDGEDFVFMDFNPAAEQIEHIKKEEIIGKSVTEIFPGVRQFGLFDVFRRVYKTGTPEHLPVSVYKDERVAGWRENYVYRLPSGQIVAVYDDVSTRKRTELVARMTPAANRITGYSIKEIMAMSDYPGSVVYEQDRDRIERAFRSALKGSTGNDVQFRIVRKDGMVIWGEKSWQPIFDDDGNSLGHRESIRDITIRKEAEDALEKASVKK